MEDDTSSQSLDGSDEEFHDASHELSTSQRIKDLGRKAVRGSKQMLRRIDVDVVGGNEEMRDTTGGEIENVTSNPVFNTGKIFHKPKTSVGLAASRAVSSAKTAAHLVTQPRDAAKSKAAMKIPASEHPYLSVEADHELVQAHDTLDKQQSQFASAEVSAEDSDIHEQSKKIQELEAHRDEVKDAWITSKHVRRARVIRRGQVKYPRVESYREHDTGGRYVRFQWELYMGHMLLWLSEDFTAQYIDGSDALPFKRGTLIHHAERFFIATMPWQEWLMHLRKVYLWEDPWLTIQWFLTFMFLLKTGYIATYFYLFVVYITLKNKFYPTSAARLRESHERAMDRGRRVYNLSELVKRHGNDQWLDPLLDELGPLIMQQLGDLADYLEILVNYYNWSDPRATWCTVMFWMSCAATAAFSSSEFGNKVVFWVCGIYFFFSRPIASRYPRYRHAVSILRWIYWDIPTHAELAFRKLQAQAKEVTIEKTFSTQSGFEYALQPLKSSSNAGNPYSTLPDHVKPQSERIGNETRSRSMSQSTSSSLSSRSSTSDYEDAPTVAPSRDIMPFRGRWDNKGGYLMITTTGLRFVRASTQRRDDTDSTPSSAPVGVSTPKAIVVRHELWSRDFAELAEVRKSKTALQNLDRLTRKVAKKFVPREALTFIWRDGSTDLVEALRKRDEAFNSIIGFSGLRWQVQPSIPNRDLAQEEVGERRDFFPRGKRATDELGKGLL